MAKIPFDVKYKPQIESGEYKVETEAGFPAKVMDWEYNNSIHGKCIAVKVIKDDGDVALLYTQKGERVSIFPFEGSNLFLVIPEHELTEFEDRLASAFCEVKTWKNDGNDVPVKEYAKVVSAELLELARKELIKDGLLVTSEYYTKACQEDYQRGSAEGKEEALKDLPRWKKADMDWDAGTIDFAVFHKHDGGDHEDWLSVEVTNRLYKGEYYIELSDLEKLPKED